MQKNLNQNLKLYKLKFCGFIIIVVVIIIIIIIIIADKCISWAC